nr:MSHA biogenesis protein MshK [Shewanella olleyana]
MQNKPIFILTILSLVCTTFLSTSFLSHAKALRDPTLPGQGYVTVTSNAERAGSLVLNSIVNSAKPHAVINNKILFVGDRIDGIRVEYIGKSYVNLSGGRKLKLFQSITER